MKSNQNTLIAILLVTAAVLGVLVAGSWQAQKAEAATVDRTMTGDYIMVTGQISESTALLYVIDIPRQTLLVYAGDSSKNTLQVVNDPIDLSRTFGR
jgi:hypothetical protein